MSIRFEAPFRAALTPVRDRLDGRERRLFDLICAAGQVGYRLPTEDINLRYARGARDPRVRLREEFPDLLGGSASAAEARAWSAAGDRLGPILLRELRRGGEDRRALRVLLAYTTIALAPDGEVPSQPAARAAWFAMVKVFARIFPSRVRNLGVLKCVARRLPKLRDEVKAGLAIGRKASGQRPGATGLKLAVDRELIGATERALGKRFSPGHIARYLFYTGAGDHIWPHPDDPQWAVTLLLCVMHERPEGAKDGSAFVGYTADGRVRRYPLAPGGALAVEPGVIHAREPVRRGERVVLLSIGLVDSGTQARQGKH